MKAHPLLYGALGLFVCLGISDPLQADRSVQSLNGPWEFQREGEDELEDRRCSQQLRGS